MNKEQIQQIPLRSIQIDPCHFDRKIKENMIQDVAQSIQDRTQMHPLIVRKNNKPNTYYLISGQIRYLALKELKHKNASCRVINCNDSEARLISLEENLRRQNLSAAERNSALREIVEINKKRIEEKEKLEATRKNKMPEQTSKEVGNKYLKKATKELKHKTVREKQKDKMEIPSKPGRKKSTLNKAITKVAETCDVSESTVRRAVTDYDPRLSDAAIRSLKRGAISKYQASTLVDMGVSEQIEELIHLSSENDKQTKRRLSANKAAQKKDFTPNAAKIINELIEETKRIRKKVDEFYTYIDGRNIDYDKIRELKLNQLLDTSVILKELMNFLED